ncbi:MAG: metallopeptidase [Lachnospiraceae bacterium]|nr:metallopeptidase [Lachnospiraceae bacterium]
MSIEISQKFDAVGREILVGSRNELYLNMRFLDLSLSSLNYVMDVNTYGLGTDGFSLYFDPQYLVDLYRLDRIRINRAYLHNVFHCIFKHILKQGGREKRLWDLACDIATEHVIDGLNHRSIRYPRNAVRSNWYGTFEKKLKVLTAEKIYKLFVDEPLLEYQIRKLEKEFRMDDHKRWPKPPENDHQPPSSAMQQLNDKWQEISEKMQTELETFSKEASNGEGELAEELAVENRERYDYKAFLRKFAVLREEMQVDLDSFDYVFYNYGLTLYGNMPLIEPQEFKEVHKIEEFVIVIDTSMSCSGELVKTFLEQTYHILAESESFFRKIHIRIIQCDEKVQSDVKITNQEELKTYMENFQIIGNGGTDFRPAFTYVQELIDRKEFFHLKGMIYFTDGYGYYPRKKPPYDTAFVFMEEDYTDVSVPSWAMKLIIEKEELEEETALRLDYELIEQGMKYEY